MTWHRAIAPIFWAIKAAEALRLPLAAGALLQITVVLGAMAAARWIHLHRTLSLLPTGVAIGADLARDRNREQPLQVYSPYMSATAAAGNFASQPPNRHVAKDCFARLGEYSRYVR